MKPASFLYFAPQTIEEALAYLAEYGYEAKVLAGGQSLIPTMNFRLAQPSALVDLNGIAELFYIRPDEGGLRIGAMTRQRQVERSPLVSERAPLLYETMPHIAHVQIRNRGTIGGSLAHADPAAELPAVVLALSGRLHLVSQRSDRWLSADQFYVSLFTTALEPDELLVEVVLPPLPAGSGWAFAEMARRHGDYALVGVAALVTVADTPAGLRCEQARLVFLSVGDGPVEAHQAAAILLDQVPTEAAIEAAAKAAASQDIDPHGDIHASADFRRHLASVLAARALTLAFQRARQRTATSSQPNAA